MKKLVLFFLFVTSTLFSQNFKLGFGYQTCLTGNDNFMPFIPGGLKIHGKYKVSEKFSLLTNTSLMLLIDDDAKRGKTYKTDNYIIAQFEESVLFYPFNPHFNPYLGFGIGYYTFALTGSEHPKTFDSQTNEDVIGESINDSFGLLISAGVSGMKGFFVELKLSILKPTLVLDVTKNLDITHTRKVNRSINFNSLFLNLGYEFSLF